MHEDWKSSLDLTDTLSKVIAENRVPREVPGALRYTFEWLKSLTDEFIAAGHPNIRVSLDMDRTQAGEAEKPLLRGYVVDYATGRRANFVMSEQSLDYSYIDVLSLALIKSLEPIDE